MRHHILALIEPHLDEIFADFYQQLLGQQEFSIYFKPSDDIQQIIERQKHYFCLSFKEDDNKLKQQYIQLGERHYDMKLPFVDFSSGIDLLQERTIHFIYQAKAREQLLTETFTFFRLIRVYTAKGYLNRILAQDALDIDYYLDKVNLAKDSLNVIAVDRLLWLKQFIYAIQKENRQLAPDFNIADNLVEHMQKSLADNTAFLHYIDDMVERIKIDASNVFFFLEKHDYSDVLPLYRELLSIYKLSLMLTNVITIANNEAVIADLVKDPLTKLLTRRSLTSLITKEFTFAEAQDYEISFIFIDIDHFKNINDQYGHAMGDYVLAEVAQIILTAIRATDFAFRYGGEEFLLVLKAAPLSVAAKQAEYIRKEIANYPFSYKQQKLNVTASFGVVTARKPFKQSVSDVIEQADKLMYKAKALGRNRVVTANNTD
jgi:diguanylate cyclase (GGDEF)-like protein